MKGNRVELGLPVPDALRSLEPERLSSTPEFYFVTLCSNAKHRKSCIASFKNYMNSRAYNRDASVYNVSDAFAARVNGRFDHYHFLFSSVNWNTALESAANIDDILNEERYFLRVPNGEVLPGLVEEGTL